MAGFNWVLSAIGSFFGAFNSVKLLGISVYVYIVVAFSLTMIAKFINGRK